MQVISRQISGLGNQLFQYAAGLYFARKYNGGLSISSEPAEGDLSHGTYPRPLLLGEFEITSKLRVKNRFDHLLLSRRPRSLAVSAPIKAVLNIAVRHEDKEQKYHFIPDLNLPPNTRTLYLAGYWQAYGYAQAVEAELRREFRLRGPASGRNVALMEQIEATETPVSLHVRRGDYTLAAEGNIALPLDYYRRAIDFVCQRFTRPVFFVFSDDVAFARENLPNSIERIFVEGNDDFRSHEDLRLMSACRHHIIANSSFSWWGAWLNAQENKTVVAPRHWLLSPQSDFSDLLPPEWHKLDSLRQESAAR